MPELTRLVPMAFVADLPRSIAFYAKLGFTVGNQVTGDDGTLTWAWLTTPGGAQLMLARASHPVEAAEQAILFYAYGRDVPAMHAELDASGVAVSPITRPFYAPRGEFRVTDPDGYAIMITHND